MYVCRYSTSPHAKLKYRSFKQFFLSNGTTFLPLVEITTASHSNLTANTRYYGMLVDDSIRWSINEAGTLCRSCRNGFMSAPPRTTFMLSYQMGLRLPHKHGISPTRNSAYG